MKRHPNRSKTKKNAKKGDLLIMKGGGEGGGGGGGYNLKKKILRFSIGPPPCVCVNTKKTVNHIHYD